MDIGHQFEKFQDIKFSKLNPTTLGVLSNRDIQVFSFENQIDSNLFTNRRTESKLNSVLKLKQIIEIGQVTTFEW